MGWPCDYSEIMNLVKKKNIKSIFKPKSKNQEKLGRIIVISDAATQLELNRKNKITGSLVDITIFSLHSVKTSQLVKVAIYYLPKPFKNKDELTQLRYLSLNGKIKVHLKIKSWRLEIDIVDQGLKINMPDICAAVGLAQIKNYKKLLPERKSIFNSYNRFFSKFNWAILPNSKNQEKESSYHLYMLRIKDIDELERDLIINFLSSKGISVRPLYSNVNATLLRKKPLY